jgi:hypothetical protein
MSTGSSVFHNPLPQSGWVLDSQLADSIGISRETLVDWLNRYSIPHRKPGSKIFVCMEVFYSHLPDGLGDTNGETKRKSG